MIQENLLDFKGILTLAKLIIDAIKSNFVKGTMGYFMGNASKESNQMVYNKKIDKYETGLLAYVTNIGAPKITPTDLTAWNNLNNNRVNHQIITEFEELKHQFQYNNLIYNAEFSFEPIVGQVYHLYKKKNRKSFLSIILPNECDFQFKASLKLNEGKMWICIDTQTNNINF